MKNCVVFRHQNVSKETVEDTLNKQWGVQQTGIAAHCKEGSLKSVIQYERLLDETFKKKNLDSFILSQKETH